MDRIDNRTNDIKLVRNNVSEKVRCYLSPARYESAAQKGTDAYFEYCLNRLQESQVQEKPLEIENKQKYKMITSTRKTKKDMAIVGLINRLNENGKLDEYLNAIYPPQKAAIIEVYGLLDGKRKSQIEVAREFNLKETTIYTRVDLGIKHLQDFEDGKYPDIRAFRASHKEFELNHPQDRIKAKLLKAIETLSKEGRLESSLDMLFDYEKNTIIHFCGLYDQKPLSRTKVAKLSEVNYRTVCRRLIRASKILDKVAVEGIKSTKEDSSLKSSFSRRNTSQKGYIPECITILQKENKLEKYIGLLSDTEKAIITKYYGLLGAKKTIQVKIADEVGLDQSKVSLRLASMLKFLDEMAGLRKEDVTSRYPKCIMRILREDRVEEILDKLQPYYRDLVARSYGLLGKQKMSNKGLAAEQGVGRDAIESRLLAARREIESILIGKIEKSELMVENKVTEIIADLSRMGQLENALNSLKEIERQSIIHTFGLFGQEKKTQKEIAGILGCTQSYISRQIRAGEKKLRKCR